jgi:hypothetical protein
MANFKKISLGLIVMLVLAACRDDELLLQRQPYIGNQLRIDGYYYCQEDNGTIVEYLYRNGIILSAYHFSTTNLNEVETKMLTEYDILKQDKSRWGVFIIYGNNIEYSAWSTSVGGGLPAFKCIGTIDNDTTFRIIKSINSDGKEFDYNQIWHFRQFSPKPDSTNNFIR